MSIKLNVLFFLIVSCNAGMSESFKWTMRNEAVVKYKEVFELEKHYADRDREEKRMLKESAKRFKAST